MPVHVDHAERRVLLAEALWRVILREGMTGASVRGVAREAELSMGSVRHFFVTQDELLQFAMREVIVRTTQRIANLAGEREELAAGGRATEAAARYLEQVLPLDQERLAEARVWMALSAHGTQNSAIRLIRREADDAIRDMCRDCLRELGHRGVDIETERLWSLLDGLTTHLAINPEHTTPDLAAAVLRAHLGSLNGATAT